MDQKRNEFSEPLLTWSAPAVHDHERSPRWYLVGAVIVLLCVAYGIVFGELSFALVMILTGGMVFLLRHTKSPYRTICIGKNGFTFENEYTPWSECVHFWFVRTPLYTELHIERKRRIGTEICIQLGGIQIEPLRTLLQPLLPEISDRKERLVDMLIRISKL